MNYQFAQLNLAEMTMPLEAPAMADFVNNLDRINGIAEQSQGFIWRFTEPDNAVSTAVFGQSMLVNMSVWTNKQALLDFTYHSPHIEIFKRRKEWFGKMKGPHMVCWYIAEGHIPSLEEARERLEYLDKNGETPWAFTFQSEFTTEDLAGYHPEKTSGL